ncbi:hypothetical protein [Streptomyces sp. NPDC046197]|uniref:hypothetical protein n=1 Tax=Streptomyces sp. NPDC046197 TaxID=3154337 RepID=UPI0033C1F392
MGIPAGLPVDLVAVADIEEALCVRFDGRERLGHDGLLLKAAKYKLARLVDGWNDVSGFVLSSRGEVLSPVTPGLFVASLNRVQPMTMANYDVHLAN